MNRCRVMHSVVEDPTDSSIKVTEHTTRIIIPLRLMVDEIEKGLTENGMSFARRRGWARREGVAMVLDVSSRLYDVRHHLQDSGLRFLTDKYALDDILTMI